MNKFDKVVMVYRKFEGEAPCISFTVFADNLKDETEKLFTVVNPNSADLANFTSFLDSSLSTGRVTQIRKTYISIGATFNYSYAVALFVSDMRWKAVQDLLHSTLKLSVSAGGAKHG